MHFPRLEATRRAALAIALGCASAAAFPSRPAHAARAFGPGARGELTVFAAVSLADVLAEAGKAWEASSGERLVFNFGASSDLARQILAGAPADVFFPADTEQMSLLAREGLVAVGASSDLLSNTLVVVVAAASAARVASASDLAAFRRIALADTEAVPAGVYARAWLEAEGVWSQVRARVVPVLHVRAALAAVESGNADAGIVYRTDAARSTRARIAFEVLSLRGPRIIYPVAPLAAARPAAASFVAYLKSGAARAVFARHGFLVLGGL